jgi:TatD DNase family protein
LSLVRPRYADSHAHVGSPGAFDEDRDEVMTRAAHAGVNLLLNLATRPEEFESTVAFAGRYPGAHAALGVHPHEAALWGSTARDRIRSLAGASPLAAIGEIGLDYHYEFAPKASQRLALVEQLRLAAELGLPVSVHSREAEEDTLRILRESAVSTHGGVLHCFTGSEAFAHACLELGMHLSFSGIVTFPKAGRLRELVVQVPAERLLVETDSPYLAPVPYRGGRNEPSRVVEVVRCVAEARGATVEAVADQTASNFEALFVPRGRPAAQ